MYICTSQSLFSHSCVVNEWLNRHCNVQIDIGIRADELGIILWALNPGFGMFFTAVVVRSPLSVDLVILVGSSILS
jgi:hypothetical protein